MPDFDRDLFNKRLKRLYSHWQNTKNTSEDVDAICAVSGSDSDSAYLKTIAIQVIFCKIKKKHKYFINFIKGMAFWYRNIRCYDYILRKNGCFRWEPKENSIFQTSRRW